MCVLTVEFFINKNKLAKLQNDKSVQARKATFKHIIVCVCVCAPRIFVTKWFIAFIKISHLLLGNFKALMFTSKFF